MDFQADAQKDYKIFPLNFISLIFKPELNSQEKYEDAMVGISISDKDRREVIKNKLYKVEGIYNQIDLGVKFKKDKSFRNQIVLTLNEVEVYSSEDNMFDQSASIGPKNNQNVNWTARDFNVIGNIFESFGLRPIVYQPKIKLVRSGYSYFSADNYLFQTLLKNMFDQTKPMLSLSVDNSIKWRTSTTMNYVFNQATGRLDLYDNHFMINSNNIKVNDQDLGLLMGRRRMVFDIGSVSWGNQQSQHMLQRRVRLPIANMVAHDKLFFGAKLLIGQNSIATNKPSVYLRQSSFPF